MTEVLDIMFGCCLPDRKRLLEALDGLSIGETILVRMENSESVKVMVGRFLKNTGCSIVEISDENRSSLVTIKREEHPKSLRLLGTQGGINGKGY